MTRRIFLGLLLCFSLNAIAQTNVEVLGGAATYHILGNANENNSNKVSSDGRLIANPMAGVTVTEEGSGKFQSATVFAGENSVAQPMAGGMYERGYVYDKGHLQVGLAAGAYEQNDNAFRKRGIEPFRMFEVGQTGVVPVAGVGINYKVDLTKHSYLRFNNVVSPVITNSTVSIGWSF